MQKQEFQEKLWGQLRAWKAELHDLRPLLEVKQEEESLLKPARGITAHEIAEALEDRLQEAKARVDGLNDVLPEAWTQRGAELRHEVETTFQELQDSFQQLASSVKQR